MTDGGVSVTPGELICEARLEFVDPRYRTVYFGFGGILRCLREVWLLIYTEVE